MASLGARFVSGKEVISQFFRRYSSSFKNAPAAEFPRCMSAWRLGSYDGIDALRLETNTDIPPLVHPKDVLVEVKAASVNSLDVMMTEGYGQQVFEKSRKLMPSALTTVQHTLLPLTLGRDFAGTILAVGGAVTDFRVGDEVMGVVPPPLNGSHAEFVVTSSGNLQLKPGNLTMEQAASIPYAGLTAWSALSITAEMCLRSKGKTVLVLGASGGVGTIAVQLLKTWGNMVVATCSKEAFPCLFELGADFIIDYQSAEADAELKQFGGFDVVLDCTGRTSGFASDLLKPWCNAKYVTLSPPVLRNFDDHGFVGGLVKSGLDLFAANSSAILEGKTLRWAFFVPSSTALRKLRDLAKEEKLKPVIDSVFSYERLPEAYEKMKAGNSQGKIIVQM